ncbi:MAG: hypothetical protein GY847_05705 [Proteobacteria bacterium]|nr:hypothetical protein [Pseudomonadota bacterium]
MKTIEKTAVTALFVALLCYSQTASAAVCFRSDRCPGEQVCINTQCTSPDKPLTTCDTPDGCSEWNTICHDGFCKPDGVSCENPGGRCTVDDGWGECICKSGEGTGWSDGDDGDSSNDPSPTDKELFEECSEVLNSDCDEEEPDVSEYCDEDGLAVCESFLEKIHDMDLNCDSGDDDETEETETDEGDADSDEDSGDSFTQAAHPPVGQDPYEPNPWELSECCEELAEESEMEDFIDCIIPLESDDCEGLEECEEATDSSDSGDDDFDNEEDEDDASDDKERDDESDDESGQDDENDEDDGTEDENNEKDDDADLPVESDDTSNSGCRSAPSTKRSSSLLLAIVSILLQ